MAKSTTLVDGDAVPSSSSAATATATTKVGRRHHPVTAEPTLPASSDANANVDGGTSATPNRLGAQTRQKRILPSRSRRGGPGVGSCDVDVMILETRKRRCTYVYRIEINYSTVLGYHILIAPLFSLFFLFPLTVRMSPSPLRKKNNDVQKLRKNNSGERTTHTGHDQVRFDDELYVRDFP